MAACIKMLVYALVSSAGLLLACTAGRRVAIKRNTEVWGPLLRVAMEASIAITQEFSDIAPVASVIHVGVRVWLEPVKLPIVELPMRME